MSVDATERLMRQIAALPRGEQVRIAQRIMSPTSGPVKVKHVCPSDLNQYGGVLNLTEDPLEYQRRVRSEWK